MGRGLSLTVNNRVQDLCMIRAGQPRQRVATVFVVAKRTISRLVEKHTWIRHSPCAPGVIGSNPGFSCLSDETINSFIDMTLPFSSR